MNGRRDSFGPLQCPRLPMALSPAQGSAYGSLNTAMVGGHVVMLEGGAGSGKSTLINRLLADRGGRRLTPRDLYSLSASARHAALDGPLLRLLENALDKHDIVAFEDFETLGETLQSRNGYERPYYWMTGMKALFDRVRSQGKVLVFSACSFQEPGNEQFPLLPLLSERGTLVKIPALSAVDYAFHLEAALGADTAALVDATSIFEHAPKLNPYQLQALAGFIEIEGRSSDAFIRDTLDHRIVNANVNTDEVANITFADLKGFEYIAQQISTYVVNPLKGDPRFADLGLRPKRGVLLCGPPGTGKTSVGRALARQMDGKFFLIDGSVSPEPSLAFYAHVQWIFDAAKRAAPSVVFIDDADVLFQTDRGTGLTRFLLTMLDGLESETAGKVAVILTAMNPAVLPPALLRSGRVELWLETKLPGQDARAEMIAAHLRDAPAAFRTYDPARAAQLAEGFNAADMRRLVMDVKALYARDILADREPDVMETYFAAAVSDINQAREHLARASRARQIGNRSS